MQALTQGNFPSATYWALSQTSDRTCQRMVSYAEPRTPLVLSDDEDLSEPEVRLAHTLYDANKSEVASICTMDAIEEHRFKPGQPYGLAPPPAMRPRSPSVYSMFMTEYAQSRRQRRCNNPSVYSMPIAAFRSHDDIDNLDDLGGGATGGYSDSSSVESEDQDYDEDLAGSDCDADLGNSQVFMTKRSRGVSVEQQGRNTRVHSLVSKHVDNFRPRCKNPSVYSMPIIGASHRETRTSRKLRTLRVAPLGRLPFAMEEVSLSYEKPGRHCHGGEEADRSTASGHALYADTYDAPRINGSRLNRMISHRVRPTASLRENVVSGYTSCRGRPNDDSLPPSYYITICVGITGLLLFLTGMTLAIIGFKSTNAEASDSAKVLKVFGVIMLVLGLLMCIGCCVYLCAIYSRFKRLSAYLKRRGVANRMRVAEATRSNTPAMELNGGPRAEVAQQAYGGTEAAADDICQMLSTLQAGVHISADDSTGISGHPLEGDTPL